jgi:hypothetical protein
VAVVAALLLALIGFAMPASAQSPPTGAADPGQRAAFRKLHAVAINSYNRKLLPKSALLAVNKLGAGTAVGTPAFSVSARQAFWATVHTDLNQSLPRVIASLKTGKSIHDLATPKQWKKLRGDVRAWVTHDLFLELYPANSAPPVLTLKKYRVIRDHIYSVTDLVLNGKVPAAKAKPTPTPKPTNTPKPTPTPKPKPTPTPKPTKTAKGLNNG